MPIDLLTEPHRELPRLLCSLGSVLFLPLFSTRVLVAQCRADQEQDEPGVQRFHAPSFGAAGAFSARNSFVSDIRTPVMAVSGTGRFALARFTAICARLSAERMTVDERRALELEHRGSVRLVHAGAEEEYSAHNTEFHTRLYRGAHNDHVFEMVTQTRARLAPFRRAQFRLPGRLAKSYEEHGRIVTAIMRADAAAAGQAAYSHVEIVSDASAVFATPGE